MSVEPTATDLIDRLHTAHRHSRALADLITIATIGAEWDPARSIGVAAELIEAQLIEADAAVDQLLTVLQPREVQA